MTNLTVKTDKIGIVDLFKLKSSGGRSYIVIPKQLTESYGLMSGDLLKLQIREVRRTTQGSSKEEEDWIHLKKRSEEE